MNTAIKTFSVAIIFSLAFSGQTMAAAYLKIGDIKGESQASQSAGPNTTEPAATIDAGNRDAHSGLPTGKRQHKPVSASTGDTGNNEEQKKENNAQTTK